MPVGPEGDDGNEPGSEEGSGPPPDPSLRAWRHPSEIAAAAAAASRPPAADRSTRRPVAVAAGTALVVAVIGVVGVLVLGAIVTLGGEASPDASALARLSSDTPNSGDSTGGSPAAGGGPVEPAAAVSSSAAQVDVANDATASPPTTGGTTTTKLTARSAELGPVDAGELPPATDLDTGIYAIDSNEPVRLGHYVAVDELVLTSASAVNGHDQLALVAQRQWIEATVLATDVATDVAVIVALDGEPAVADRLSSSTGFALAELPIGAEVGVRTTVDETTSGIVIGTNQRIITRTGIPIYGALLTTARLPDGGSGAALIGDDGAVAGLVIDSVGYLASAVPIERAAAVGQSLVDRDVPSAEWLGVEGRARSGGGAELDTVVTASPAAAAGLEPDDVIVGFGATEVIDWFHLIHLIRQTGPEVTVTLEIERGETSLTLPVTIGSRYESGE